MWNWWVLLGILLFTAGRGIAQGTKNYLDKKDKKAFVPESEKMADGIIGIIGVLIAIVLITMGVTTIINQV